jgi:Cu+-exporting ATPase
VIRVRIVTLRGVQPPVQRVSLDISPVLADGEETWAGFTVAEASQLTAGLLAQAAAAEHCEPAASRGSAAYLGLAMGTGSDATIEASDLTLVRSDLLAVPDAIELSRRTLATIKGNLFWAFGYNTVAIPLAALGLLNPLIAAAAMAFSLLFVVTISLRLRRFQPARVPAGAAHPGRGRAG